MKTIGFIATKHVWLGEITDVVVIVVAAHAETRAAVDAIIVILAAVTILTIYF